MGIDPNVLDEGGIRRLLHYVGVLGPRADSIADAVLDWIDADDSPRAFGAESDWYASAGALSPRNGSLTDASELLDVRGVSALEPQIIQQLLVALETTGDRLVLGRAQPAALAALPGFGREAVNRVLALRDTRAHGDLRRIGLDLSSIREGLSSEARAELDRHATQVAALTTITPAAWYIRASVASSASGADQQPPIVEYRLVRSGSDLVVARGSVIR